MGFIVFFEGNNANQDIVEIRRDTPGQRFRPRQNDEIGSLKLQDVRPGTVIRLYDDGRGRQRDDWCEIVVKRSQPEYVINTLERDIRDRDGDSVILTYHARDNLDGKVSWIEIDFDESVVRQSSPLSVRRSLLTARLPRIPGPRG